LVGPISFVVARARASAGTCRAFARLIFRVAVGAALAFVCAQQAPRAQQPPTPPQAPSQQRRPTFRAEANLVRVDAYVNAAGRPVDDLRAEEFEVLEDGVRQKIETFELVKRGQVVAPPGAAQAPEPRGRLFILFIDTYHLPWVDRERLERREKAAPGYREQRPIFPVVLPPPIPDDGMLRQAMCDLVTGIVGDLDRVALLTPDMWAASPTFLTRREAVEGLKTMSLEAYQPGKRPPEIVQYEACFPNGPAIEPEMRVRYRTFRVFNVLQELLANLELVRDERKAVLVVTRGWNLPPRIRNYVDPRMMSMFEDYTVCHTERVLLADKDFDEWFRALINEARRANVAFYPVYAHPFVTYGRPGPDIDEDLRKFQSQWGSPPPHTTADFNMTRSADGFPLITRQRHEWQDILSWFAKDTNGRAILTADDFEKGMKDIADELASCYLLGYSSTNTALDGKYRRITVNVKRPKTTVRARAGYRAVMPNVDERASAAAARDTVPPVVTAAFAPLARLRSDTPFRLLATAEPVPAGSRLRLVGELDAEQLRQPEWKPGWRTEITVTTAQGSAAGTAAILVKAGERVFVATFPESGTLPPGDYQLRARAVGSDGQTVFEDRATVTVAAAASAGGEPTAGQALLYRKPTGPRTDFQPTADQRFTRRETLMVEVPLTAAADAPAIRIIDRLGLIRDAGIQPSMAERDGVPVMRGAFVLSNIAPGDYVLELTPFAKTPDRKVLVGFRIVP